MGAVRWRGDGFEQRPRGELVPVRHDHVHVDAQLGLQPRRLVERRSELAVRRPSVEDDDGGAVGERSRARVDAESARPRNAQSVPQVALPPAGGSR